MPHRLNRFRMSDMVRLGQTIRNCTSGCRTATEAAQKMVEALFAELLDEQGQPALALARLFVTKRFANMPLDAQAVARNAPGGNRQLVETTRCLMLKATCGSRPEWNSPHTSQGHRAIPLWGRDVLEKAPMLASLWSQFGVNTDRIFSEQTITPDVGHNFNVFHVAEAAGSALIPAQESFVIPEKISSVLGFGGALPNGEMFAVLMFSRVAISETVAALFRPIALSVRVGLVSQLDIIESDTAANTRDELRRLKAQVDAAQQILDTQTALVMASEDRLEEALHAVERSRDAALEASRVKSEFLANMSHEIRTPMNGVIGFANLLTDTPLNTDQAEFVSTIRRSGEALMDIINDLLDFSKIEAGKMLVEKIPCNVRQVAAEVCELLAPRLDSRPVELILDWHPDVPDWALGDTGRLRQVLLNLVGNAIKFTPAGQVVVRALHNGNALRLEVADTGIGIPAEKQPLLFASFMQADASTTRQYGGTGLGLAISQRLVRAMDSQIELVSTAGVGSTFAFCLPLAPAAQPASETAWVPAQGRIRVLVVDDLPTNRRLLEALLDRWKIRSSSAESAEQAWAMLQQAHSEGEPFTAAIVDHMMPDVDGEEFGRRVLADPQLGGTHLILLTSSAAGRLDAQRLRKLGFAEVLSKPLVRPQVLLDLLQADKLATSKRPVPPVVSASPPSGVTQPYRVLVAEDNLVNQELAALMLSSLGCEVDLAGNGREALAMAVKTRYDVIFMDCQMPTMDGFQSTAAIRQAGLKSPVVALTANALIGDRERCLQAGMNDYITKPLRMSDLMKALAAWGSDSKAPNEAQGKAPATSAELPVGR
ncbi:MAG: response regulator [Acidobacteria bacterium]|nr:response regulator [Acidobacteriota bacterium]